MRVSEETLNRGWVCMGWCVSGLLLRAYNNITHQQRFFVSYFVGGSFIILSSTISPRIAVTVKQCESAKKP